jgi:threonine/homoserine/homoserine lactone efflux protein
MTTSFFGFLLITILLVVTPGADMALITRASMRGGVKSAFFTQLGITIASMIWACLAAAGVMALIEANPFSKVILMIVGAAYMIYIGVKDIVAGRVAWMKGTGTFDALPEQSPWTLLQNGFLVNITNPKVGLYYATVLPNFVPASGNPSLYIVVLGLVHCIVGFTWFMLYSVLLGRGLNLFKHPNTKSVITILTGIALITIGLIAFRYAFSLAAVK